jgi:hypothetical protein
MSSTGFAFANPQPSPNDFNTFDPKDVYADSAVVATPVIEAIPAPWKKSPVMALADVLGNAVVQQIQNSGQIVFHSGGDTGGVTEPSHQFAVADAMTDDLTGKDYSRGRPPRSCSIWETSSTSLARNVITTINSTIPTATTAVRSLPFPEVTMGALFPLEPVKYSLQPFYEHFCSKTPTNDPSAKGFARTTMPHGGVYFTLNAPFLKIIGLYSNTGESAGVLSGGVAGTQQTAFLLAQLRAAAAHRKQAGSAPFALFIAVHHPPVTISSEHFSSPQMLAEIDTACQTAGIWPDLARSGHAHRYERYTRAMKADGRKISYLVAGIDGKGNKLTLIAYNDNVFGFLRLTVSAKSIQCQSLGVDETTRTSSVMDEFTLDLTKHMVGGAAAPKSRKKAKLVTVIKRKVPRPGVHSRMGRKKPR